MNNNKIIKHPIQQYIINVLMHQKTARFRDLKPIKTDTNLTTYHIKLLLQQGILNKQGNTYTLSQKYSYILNNLTKNPQQIDIILLFVIQNSSGDVLLEKRAAHPNMGNWTLPYAQISKTCDSLTDEAQRQAFEKFGLAAQTMKHAGDCYVRVKDGDKILATTLSHVFTFNRDNIATDETLQWARPHKLAEYDLVPATEHIMTRSFFGDDFFFEEFEETLLK